MRVEITNLSTSVITDENSHQSPENNYKAKQSIFSIKKYRRNGLLEKKMMKKNQIYQSGKWMKEENTKFIRTGIKHGANWKKLKQEIGTRTHAQIRSHAQKFLINLCKKYNIEIKSRRKANFSLTHLNFPYRRKSEKNVVSLDRISKVDLGIITKFNFYIKNVDLEPYAQREDVIFRVEKVNKTFSKDPENSMSISENVHTSNNSSGPLEMQIVTKESILIKATSEFPSSNIPFGDQEVIDFFIKALDVNKGIRSVLEDYGKDFCNNMFLCNLIVDLQRRVNNV